MKISPLTRDTDNCIDQNSISGSLTTHQGTNKIIRSQDKQTRFVALKDLFLSPEIHIKCPILYPSNDLKTDTWKFR